MYSHVTNPIHREAIERRELGVTEFTLERAMHGADQHHHERGKAPVRFQSVLRRWFRSRLVPVWKH